VGHHRGGGVLKCACLNVSFGSRGSSVHGCLLLIAPASLFSVAVVIVSSMRIALPFSMRATFVASSREVLALVVTFSGPSGFGFS
jgi:hypothetical protein